MYMCVLMEVSESTYNEIRKLLEEAGYDQAIVDPEISGEDKELLDMRGIALTLKGHL